MRNWDGVLGVLEQAIIVFGSSAFEAMCCRLSAGCCVVLSCLVLGWERHRVRESWGLLVFPRGGGELSPTRICVFHRPVPQPPSLYKPQRVSVQRKRLSPVRHRLALQYDSPQGPQPSYVHPLQGPQHPTHTHTHPPPHHDRTPAKKAQKPPPLSLGSEFAFYLLFIQLDGCLPYSGQSAQRGETDKVMWRLGPVDLSGPPPCRRSKQAPQQTQSPYKV